MSNLLTSANGRKFFWRLALLQDQNPQAQKYFLGASAFFVLLGINQGWKKQQAEKEIEFRKTQLAKPLYELQNTELTFPPWNKNNLSEWLYRPVRVTGRPIHGRAIYIPTSSYGKRGYEYVVPFVTNENADGTAQQGFLVSLGFIPARWKNITEREYIEDCSSQTFDCFVSQLVELQNSGPFFAGNNTVQRSNWNWADLDKMAQTTGFLNAENIKDVVLERVHLQSPNDERNSQHYDMDADQKVEFPYIKSRSGALQFYNHMPWDYSRRQNYSFGTAAIFGSLALVLQFVR